MFRGEKNEKMLVGTSNLLHIKGNGNFSNSVFGKWLVLNFTKLTIRFAHSWPPARRAYAPGGMME